jgi:hypothetical protein
MAPLKGRIAIGLYRSEGEERRGRPCVCPDEIKSIFKTIGNMVLCVKGTHKGRPYKPTLSISFRVTHASNTAQTALIIPKGVAQQ